MPQTRDSLTDIWGARTPHEDGQWPARADEMTVEQPERWVQSVCLLCSNGCALDIGVRDGRMVGVRGRIDDRVNRGRLGPKGLYGWKANASKDRLRRPLVRRSGKLVETSWDEAMDLIVRRSKEIIADATGDAIGIYNTGQLFLEEYYTLSILARAGIGTHNMDGNTRLCTATADQALKETFGSDGQPGSYRDIDEADCLFLAGHNMSSTQTVLWARVLDRRRGPNPPKLVVVDTRVTWTAEEADVHLAPRVGSNVALMNGLLNLVIRSGGVDRDFIERHTVGFDKLAAVVSEYAPERVERITGVPAAKLREAARLIASAKRLFSTVLQGFYQSNQATAAAVQVNNLNLVRGMIGRPGCGLLQMNGQPSAENTRETGANGEFPALRNWQNGRHMEDLACRWNVDPLAIPHWHLPAHAMEIFRKAELGAVRMLWVICTNPAASLPELHRIRRILAKPDLFLVVQDAFLTETAQFADVLLPAAIWGEKTGTCTNADRTVHLARKAIEPPGEARADLDIFIDYAQRMDFRDKDGAPLVKWRDAEGAFDHWRMCSKGWLCDYSGMTYAKLSGGSGIQWPCNEAHPQGTERLYTDHVFRTGAEVCETFGHDIETGAAIPPEEYAAHDPGNRAILKPAHYLPPAESPDEHYPFWLTTGRVVFQFHTRTKTARTDLDRAAPEMFAEISAEDASRLGVAEGDELEITSRRGRVKAKARIGRVLPGHVFLPFHYGYWDDDESHDRAANELTTTTWDPVSKQPHFKFAAVQVAKGGVKPAERLGEAASRLAGKLSELGDKALSSAHTQRSRVADYLGLLAEAHREFRECCARVAAHHVEEWEVQHGMELLSEFSAQALTALEDFAGKYGEYQAKEPSSLRTALFPTPRAGAFGVLRDLHALYVMAGELRIALTVVTQAAKALRDKPLLAACAAVEERTKRQQAWIFTQIEHRAASTVVVPQ